MTSVTSTVPSLHRESAIQGLLAERFVPLALRGLERSLVEGGDWFCFRARKGPEPSALRVEGRSERYTAMALLGLQRQSEFGRSADVPFDRLLDDLVHWAADAPVPGDVGLVLWLCALRGDQRADTLAKSLLARESEVLAPGVGVPSMETGCLLIGLAEAERMGVGGRAVARMADDVAEVLTQNQDERSHLFSFSKKVRRKNVFRNRMDSRLGSFASQVYPAMGLALHARATGDPRSARAARVCADRICELQGEAGQWWWIYNTVRGTVAVRYPVYTVHQDAMGPMMLCAAELGGGYEPRYDLAIERSFSWFDRRPELPSANYIDGERGMVWRSAQHDDPETTQRLGLSTVELSRMGWSAWTGAADERLLEGNGGYVCGECRPYHLGWILLADALYRDCVTRREALR